MILDLIAEQSDVKTDKLFLLVLGASGAGKSFCFGTAPGKIAYIYLNAERHGVSSARKSGNNIIPILIDIDKTGAERKPDEAVKYGLAALNPEALKKAEITTVVVDGLTELEKLVRRTKKWQERCETASGKHNSFAEPAATVEILDQFMTALRIAQDTAGVHVVVSGILDVQEADANGSVTLAKPRATGYTVAESMIQQFPDILVIGEVTKRDGTSGRVFQTGGELKKVSVDEDKKVKRFINFSCRLSGVAELPTFIKADLKSVIELKTSGK
jgi:hypothetical protein